MYLVYKFEILLFLFKSILLMLKYLLSFKNHYYYYENVQKSV